MQAARPLSSNALQASLLSLAFSCGLVIAFGVSGCRLQASASADLNSGADANAAVTSTPAPKSEDERVKSELTRRSIVYSRGKLAYRGVINFEYNRAELQKDEETQGTLEEFRKFLTEQPSIHLEVQGHTDSRGSDEYNKNLSDRRANAVKDWLAAHQIAGERLTAIGKGEDAPQVPEPEACDDKVPADTAPCEETWAVNRRVVFEVTSGGEELQKIETPPPAAPPPPAPEPVAAAAPPPACPFLIGPRLGLLGPNTWVVAEGAIQPKVCWLELSLGLGLWFSGFDGSGETTSSDGGVVAWTIPARGRIWFMDEHSLIGDVGLGLTHYSASSSAADAAGNRFDYDAGGWIPIANLGVGYGYRPRKAESGPRLAAVIGLLFHLGDWGYGEATASQNFSGAEAALLQADLDDAGEALVNLQPYGEISLGYLF
jgi:outer membrane protein OmpA-like peptidoglycan-associated protein